ncbi:enterobactin synthase subunit EntD [Pseudescherichia vulneris]
MNTQHSTFSLGGLTLHRIDFDPATFTDADLLWLPHHAKLQPAGNKRKAEHLAGRLAAFYALRQYGLRHIADIGDRRQPIWPPEIYGSISHSGTTALAVGAKQPVGVDLDAIFTPEMTNEVVGSIVTPEERRMLEASGLPFELALTLAFSAKESLYKAYSFATSELPGFNSAQVIALNAGQITLGLTAAFSPDQAGEMCQIHWRQDHRQVITLLSKTLQSA